MQKVNVNYFRELLWTMTEKELRARYKNTILGFIWLVANPVLQMIVIGFVFPLFIQTSVRHYNYYLFTGLLAWNFFSLSLSKATPSIVFERSLIKKAMFPRAVIPASIVLSNLINYVAAFVLFIIPVGFLHTLTILSPAYFFFGLFLLVVFTVGMSLLTSALNVKYRDIHFLTQALLVVWFYATPIVYALSQIPSDLVWLWTFNPITASFLYMQHALVGSALPPQHIILGNVLIVMLITVAGIVMFSRESKNFDDWL